MSNIRRLKLFPDEDEESKILKKLAHGFVNLSRSQTIMLSLLMQKGSCYPDDFLKFGLSHGHLRTVAKLLNEKLAKARCGVAVKSLPTRGKIARYERRLVRVIED